MKGFKFLSFGFDLPPSIVFGYFINLMLVLPGRKKIYLCHLRFNNISNSHHQMSNQKGCNHSLSHLCGISWLEFVFLPFSLCIWNSRRLPRVDTAHLWCPRWFHFWHLLHFPRPFFSDSDKPASIQTNPRHPLKWLKPWCDAAHQCLCIYTLHLTSQQTGGNAKPNRSETRQQQTKFDFGIIASQHRPTWLLPYVL